MNDELKKALVELFREAAKEIGTKVNVGAGTANLAPATWFTAPGMFSPTGSGDLISAVVEDTALSKWLGAFPSIVDPVSTQVLGWYGPEGTERGSPYWERSGECSAPPGVEWGKCELLHCFGEVAFSGGDLSLLRLGVQNAPNTPKYYVNGPGAGQPITDERVYQLSLAAAVANQAYERLLIVGNKGSNPLHFDGLETLINTPIIDYRTGLRCVEAEPLIVDWASNAMSSNICSLISAMVRRLRTRARFLGNVQRGDMVLVMTSLMRDALIDFAACGCGPCTGSQYNEVSIDPLAARQEQARLASGGTYGMGMFEVDGIPVDIITCDWIPQTSSAPHFCSDIFILTRKVGAELLLFAEYQDFSKTLAGVPADRLVQGATVTDGGKFLVISQNVHECFNQELFMKARLRLRAPWLQGRITNVCAPFDIPPMTPIPGDVYSFMGNSPYTAEKILPTQYGNCEGL